MDPKKCQLLKSQAASAADSTPDQTAVVPLDTFLDGNDDDGSFASNCMPDIDTAARLLRSLEKKKNVAGVFIEIVDPMMDDDGSWPYSDRVYVVTTASVDETAEHFEEFPPDETSEVSFGKLPRRAPALTPGQHVVSLWWD